MKNELFKVTAITMLFSVIALSAFTTMGFASYPGPDSDSDSDNGVLEGVSSAAQGAYQTGTFNQYKDVYHGASRWVVGPSSYVSSLIVSFWTDQYSQMNVPVAGDSAGGPGYDIWTAYVASAAYCEFTNDWLGGWWTRSCSSLVYASA